MAESQEKIIEFKRYDTLVEANLAKTKLDAYGIPCFLTDEHFGNLYPISNGIFPGVRLHLFEKDKARPLKYCEVKFNKKVKADCNLVFYPIISYLSL